MADRMVEDGYLEAGYEYLVIDDCWSLKQRDADGNLVPDPEKFPHGMKWVSDYVHEKDSNSVCIPVPEPIPAPAIREALNTNSRMRKVRRVGRGLSEIRLLLQTAPDSG